MSKRRTSIDDAAFGYRARKSGDVEITPYAHPVSILRGDAAARFKARIQSLGPSEAQHLMARFTGNFERGNERRGHSRGRINEAIQESGGRRVGTQI